MHPIIHVDQNIASNSVHAFRRILLVLRISLSKTNFKMKKIIYLHLRKTV